MEVENLLNVRDTLDAFIEVQIFQLLKQPESAINVLCNVQNKLQKLCFSSDQSEGQSQAFQHNLMEEITCGEDGEVSEEEDGDMVVKEAVIVERNSPKRKKRQLEESSKEILSFEAFDSLPVLSRSAPEWNKLQAENPQFWRKKCLEWHKKLEQAFVLKEE